MSFALIDLLKATVPAGLISKASVILKRGEKFPTRFKSLQFQVLSRYLKTVSVHYGTHKKIAFNTIYIILVGNKEAPRVGT